MGVIEDGNQAAAASSASAVTTANAAQQQQAIAAAAAALPPRQKPAKHCSDTCFKVGGAPSPLPLCSSRYRCGACLVIIFAPGVTTHTGNCADLQANDGVCDEGRPASKPAQAGGAAAAAAAAHRRSLQTLTTEGHHSGQRQGRRLQEFEGQEAVSPLQCDLGTDCADCGAWEGTVPEGWWVSRRVHMPACPYTQLLRDAASHAQPLRLLLPCAP